MRIVIKFGGTSVATTERINDIARKIARLSRGHEVAVVVSAMGNQTSELLKLFHAVNRAARDKTQLSEVVGLGEILSARLMAAALTGIGLPAVAVTPDKDSWPVFARAVDKRSLAGEKINQEGTALIDRERTAKACRKRLLPLMKKGVIPVVCGFLALDNGKLITLGRGGSDITATLLGRGLKADKVIIVTDVTGVMRGDPKLVRVDQPLAKISVKEIEILSRGGARVVHPAALLHKLPGQKTVIMDFKNPNYRRGGTEIVGHIRARVFRTREKLAFLTIVGQKFLATAGLLQKITRILSEKSISIYGISISENYIGLYVREDLAQSAYQYVYGITHTEPKFKAVSILKNIGRLRVTSSSFIDEPGVIGRIGDLLALNDINILEMNTVKSDITIFLGQPDLPRAYRQLKNMTF
jgi:aspartate kinase